jgi:DNA (cytosine-5)-methyltransferase 1
MNYYNENDPKAAAWLRELINAHLIPEGIVDERSILDVEPDQLADFAQCHFFAGIGGWSRALELADWPATIPVWTGSCPCQPFSAAGKGGGFADERHLWPAWFHLINQCRPPVVFGEQVASPAGLAWFDLVSADLEGAGYSIGAADLCAAGVGAPHIRQRLWFVGIKGGLEHNIDPRLEGQPRHGNHEAGREITDGSTGATGESDRMAYNQIERFDWEQDSAGTRGRYGTENSSGVVRMADDKCDEEHQKLPRPEPDEGGRSSIQPGGRGMAVPRLAGGRPGPSDDFWDFADWLRCRDNLWRPVEPGTFPLADGVPGRVGLLRGYGNSIVPQVAAEFIGVVMEALT